MAFSSFENKIEALTLNPKSASDDVSFLYPRNSECYYALTKVDPNNKDLLEKLQKERLNFVLKQLEKEREDLTFSRTCLFCKQHFVGNRSLLLDHLWQKHNFSIGIADNIVFIHELLNVLEQMLKNLQCFYCEKTFKDWSALKEHMRKKQHKCINPKNKNFDRFYIINYLQLGKTWTDLQGDDDNSSQESDEEMDMESSHETSLCVCLFCDYKLPGFSEICIHMKEIHNFDFISLRESHKLNFYSQIKLINFIRRKVFERQCITCDLKFMLPRDLLKHMMESGHILLFPDEKNWDQTMYYFPTFENDNLLCALEVKDSDCQDEEMIYPEETVMPSSTVLQDENIRQALL